ncbi:MAG: hypothetical protein R3Y08_01785 [Rikenellaceae bacterium]
MLLSFAFTSCSDSAPEENVPDEPVVEEPVAAKIEVEVKDVTFASVEIAMDPGDYTGNYYAALVSFDEYDAIMDGSKDPNVLVEALMLMEIKLDTDLEAVDNLYVFSGAAELDLADGWQVAKETEYYVCAFPITGKYGELNGDVTMEKVETPAPPMSDVTFDIEMTTITETKAQFVVTPSDEEVDFFYSVYDPDTIERYSDDGDEFFHFMELAIKGCVDLDYYTTSGVKELSYEGLSGSTNYTLVVFAVNKDTDPMSPYSKMVTYDFKTSPIVVKPELPEGSSDDFAIDVVSLTSSELVVSVTPKEFTGNYIVCAVPYSQLESDYDCDIVEYSATVCSFYSYFGFDFHETDGVNVCSGAVDEIKLSELVSDPEAGGCYIISCFGVDPDESDPYAQVITGVSSYIEVLPVE